MPYIVGKVYSLPILRSLKIYVLCILGVYEANGHHFPCLGVPLRVRSTGPVLQGSFKNGPNLQYPTYFQGLGIVY